MAEPLTPAPMGSNFVAVSAPGHSGARVYFDHDSADVDGNGQQTIMSVLQAYGGGPLSVEGHASTRASITDPVQRKIVNLKVSMERAFNVARSLISGGVPARSVRTVAWGESQPALAMGGKDTESASRRVDIFAHSGQ